VTERESAQRPSPDRQLSASEARDGSQAVREAGASSNLSSSDLSVRVAELEALLDCQRDVVLLYDPDMNVRRANAAFAANYGFAPEGMNVREIIARVRCRLPDGSPMLLEEQPTPSALRGQTVVGRTFLVTRADGTSVAVESTATPMHACGKIIGSVTVWHDVTQQRRTEAELKGSEAALRESESLLRSFFDSPGLLRGIVEMDGDSIRFVSLSTAAAQLYGLPEAEVRGKTADDLGVPRTVTGVWLQHYRMAYRTRSHVTFELQRQVGDFAPWFACTVSYLDDGPNGKPRFGYVMADISEIKRATQAVEAANARLEEADRRKNEFLAALSHELRNPLAPIKNSLYVLEHAAPGGEQAARAKAVIDRQVTQLSNLVDELLDVTRVVRNKIQLQKEPLELGEVVHRVVEDYRSLFEASHLHVNLVTNGAPVPVLADRTRIVQVVGNLLQNAAKFSKPRGRTRVALSSDGPSAVIRVTDDGAGMDAATLSRVFEPFMQADKTLDRSKGGLGLGLALVKGLVALHGGEVAAHSAGLGKGCEVVVRLPLALGAAPAAPNPTTERARRRRRILIIEDNLDAASSLREVLELDQHDVTVAHTGPEGVQRTRELRPEVVLCDIGLPGMDGYQVAQVIREDATLCHTHLIALSGYALPEDLRRAAQAGFEHHLAKPPSIEKLERILASLPSRQP
jgi:PAS domain S-box-containing protein